MDDSGWQLIKSNKQSFIVRRSFSVTNFKIQLSDYKRLWGVEGNSNELLCMSQKENPLCEFDLAQVTRNIFNLFDKCIDSLIVEGTDEKFKHLKMSSSLASRPFILIWSLSDQGPDVLYEEVTHPLLLFTNEMSERQNYLCKLILGKDREIMEHVHAHGELTWSRVKSEKFDVEEFKNELFACAKVDPIQSMWEEPNVRTIFNKNVLRDKAKIEDHVKNAVSKQNEVIVKQEENVCEAVPVVQPKLEVVQVKEAKSDESTKSKTVQSKRKKVKLNL